MNPRLAALLLLLSPLAASAAEPLSAAQYATVRELVKPAAEDDTWLQVPWRTNLWEARREAAREGKPILLWEMDGHPLGCT